MHQSSIFFSRPIFFFISFVCLYTNKYKNEDISLDDDNCTPSSTTQIDAICEDMNAVLDTLANWKACEEKIERVDVDSRHVRMKYEDQLRNDLNEFESACEETRNDMLKNGPASDKSLLDLHAGALKLNEFKTKINDRTICTT